MFKLSLLVGLIVIQWVYCQSNPDAQDPENYGFEGLMLLDDIELLQRRFWSYQSKLTEVKKTNNLESIPVVTLGYRLAKYDSANPGVCEVEKLIDEQPELVKTFPWNKTITFLNSKFSKYLSYAETLTGGNRFSQAKDGITNTRLWTFETFNNGESFRFTNTQTNEVLYPSDDANVRDSKRRNVFTSADKSKYPAGADQWKFELTPDGSKFKIKNVYYREYLYIYDYIVLTWRPPICDGSECEWTIKAQ